MDDEELGESLNRVGKACFVSFFEEFSDSSLTREEVVRIALKKAVKPSPKFEASMRIWCIPYARKIIETGRGKDALLLIAVSPRMLGTRPDITDKARRLAETLSRCVKG